jgi:hypothetical protein
LWCRLCEIVYARSGLVQSMSYIGLPTFNCNNNQ